MAFASAYITGSGTRPSARSHHAGVGFSLLEFTLRAV